MAVVDFVGKDMRSGRRSDRKQPFKVYPTAISAFERGVIRSLGPFAALEQARRQHVRSDHPMAGRAPQQCDRRGLVVEKCRESSVNRVSTLPA